MIAGSNGGTRYKILWRSDEADARKYFPSVDTGEQPPPEDDNERDADFRDDFKQARRCLAAATATAAGFLAEVTGNTKGNAEMKPVEMLVKTDGFDRGVVHLLPDGTERFDLDIHIGAGFSRPPNALPEDEWSWTWKAVDASGSASHVARALKVLSSAGRELLYALPVRDVGSAAWSARRSPWFKGAAPPCQ